MVCSLPEAPPRAAPDLPHGEGAHTCPPGLTPPFGFKRSPGPFARQPPARDRARPSGRVAPASDDRADAQHLRSRSCSTVSMSPYCASSRAPPVIGRIHPPDDFRDAQSPSPVTPKACQNTRRTSGATRAHCVPPDAAASLRAQTLPVRRENAPLALFLIRLTVCKAPSGPRSGAALLSRFNESLLRSSWALHMQQRRQDARQLAQTIT